MPKPQPFAPPDAVALFEKLVATLKGVERKGATLPYTSLNGHMFSLLTKDGYLALRLPAGAREAFLKKYQTTIAVQYGHTLPEYVVVPAALLKKTAELKPHFAASYAYVASLRPKPTTRAAAGTKAKGKTR
jgi:hypothetical protein